MRRAACEPHVHRARVWARKMRREEDTDTAARIKQLEEELAAARKTIAALMARSESDKAPAEFAVFETTARLEAVIAARTRELAEKGRSLEEANRELHDLTANLDQIVRQRTRALAESEAQLRRRNIELDRLNRLKSEFISIAAHEFRTPMTAIIGYLDLIADERLGGTRGAQTTHRIAQPQRAPAQTIDRGSA